MRCDPVSADADALDREAVDGEPVGGGEDPLVLERGGDDPVASPSGPRGTGGALDGQVVGLGPPGGEDDLAGLGAERCRDEGLARLEWAVLDWNTLAINFYDALGATAKLEWITRRLSGEALASLAGP